jgi:hypothetical protein
VARVRASRRAPASSAQSPNTVLVIFLIFFILATLLTGVLAYYGYDGQKKLKKEVEDALAREKVAKKQQEWAEFQSYLARKALGVPLAKEGIDEETQWQAAIQEVSPDNVIGGKFGGEKNKGPIEELIKRAKQDLGWDDKNKQFLTTYTDKLAKLQEELTQARAGQAQLAADKEALKKDLERLLSKRQEFYDKLAADLKEHNEKVLTAAQERSQQFLEALKQNEALNKRLQEAKEQMEQLKRAKEKEIAGLRKELQTLKTRQSFEGVPTAAPSKPAQVHALLLDISQGKPLWDQPVARISRVEWTTRKIYLNKGKMEGIRPGMTFLIFGAGPDGRALGPLKGTATVEEVIGDHQAVAWLTSLYDASGVEVAMHDYLRFTRLRQNENPIREGDLLFNLAFGAHVAVLGAPGWSARQSLADLAEEQQQFLRLLAKQGVQVDAYLDLRDGELKGALTPATNYLIVGVQPPVPAKAGPESKLLRSLAAQAKALTDQAVAAGVFVISAQNFLNVIGYRPFQGAEDSTPSGFRPGPILAGTPSNAPVSPPENRNNQKAP